MGLLNKLFHKKENEKSYLCELEKKLDENQIPYDIEESEDEVYLISYIDAFNNISYIFTYTNDTLLYNGREIEEKEAYRLIDIKWKIDSKILEYMDDENYNDIFDIMEFFEDITSENGLIAKMLPLKEEKGISLLYSIGKTPTENDYLVGIELNMKKGIPAFYTMPEKQPLDTNSAIIYIFKKIYEEARLFFTSGSYKVPESRFSDIIKLYMTNLSLVERLNEINNVEAQVMDAGKNNTVFVMFQNGSAIEYMSSTKQNPNGNVLMIDYDEDNLVEDNEEYSLVSKIIKLPSMIKDKPDERKIPERNFTNKKTNRKINKEII